MSQTRSEMIPKTRISSHQQSKSQKARKTNKSPPQRAMQDSIQLYREVNTPVT
ncbi:hypothetical protein HOY80DRAFT_989205 [Tuber brumale]|nr:hypothetical protein HOY80DRAFT_989205 [Tuber brumale]